MVIVACACVIASAPRVHLAAAKCIVGGAKEFDR